ncbi:MAG: hypothetical protein PWR07_2212 [Bacillota bacterium]|nr:hypothetical protein [Bacillota bacterium]
MCGQEMKSVSTCEYVLWTSGVRSSLSRSICPVCRTLPRHHSLFASTSVGSQGCAAARTCPAYRTARRESAASSHTAHGRKSGSSDKASRQEKS